MIGTNTKSNYLEAIKDIRAIMLGPCPVNIVGVLAHEMVPTILRRWVLSDECIKGDIRADFQAVLAGLDKIIEVFPAEPWLRVMRGRALMAVGWHGRAIDDFEQATGKARESAERHLYMAEAYFSQAKQTMNDPLPCYTSAAFHASKAIQCEAKSPRPYLARARSDAHILRHCGYGKGTPTFAKKHKDIQADLAWARKHAGESEQPWIDTVEAGINALLEIN